MKIYDIHLHYFLIFRTNKSYLKNSKYIKVFNLISSFDVKQTKGIFLIKRLHKLQVNQCHEHIIRLIG